MRSSRPMFPTPRALLGALCLFCGALCSAQPLPAAVTQALQRAQVPPEALSVLVQETGSARQLLAHQSGLPVNPASLMKLLTTAAALDQLGPAWAWATPVWLAGTVQGGVLEGSVHIKGSGDPKLVLERIWLLLRRVQQAGVREIRGDFVLDRSAFAASEAPLGEFDGEVLRPYNVRPDSLLLNYKAVIYTFVPDAARGVATVQTEPTLAGAPVDRTVPLTTGECGDWRAGLRASFNDPARVRFAGSYAATCGEKFWPVADANPASYNARLIEALWREMGGKLSGSVRDGPAPSGLKPSFEFNSPPLAEVVRDINKYSNNVMAQQLFLSLPLALGVNPPATLDAARESLQAWWQQRLGVAAGKVTLDNGSGLSRETRLSAQQLTRLLQLAWASPWMSELMSSLPVSGTDGTLRRQRNTSAQAHLKTGSLRDVAGLAGYVLGDSGRHVTLVAIINHPNANAARPALDALVQWAMRDVAPR